MNINNKEEAAYIAEVLKKHSEGAKIEYRSNNNTSWGILKDPYFDDDCVYHYRIKPEPKLRPYKTIKEFLKAQKEHGPYVCFSDGVYNIPKSVITMRDKVICEFETLAYKSINSIDLINYHWQDGTPCGIEE